ncbi:MAG: N-carbamoylputrescine amidase [Bacteroidetes bacterium]|jgi:N-carbamoylputrescine amidase|nr:N-carbamoylputrescine amidase [Bacteroidota bacterium]
MRQVTLAATQMSCSWDLENNILKAEAMIRIAASDGANVVLIQELFETPYFCIEQKQKHFELAKPFQDHPTINRMAKLAKELSVVIPVSFFERANHALFNSVAMIDANGEILGLYRKTHIPNAIGYQEKHYFNPGDTGFKVWETQFGKIGLGICWDQWFPETARCLCLKGAEILLYPTAIGSEPGENDFDSKDHWQRAMQGHAAANIVPVVASNRIGVESADPLEMTFYGSSFIADHTGAKVTEADRNTQAVITASFDLDEISTYRTNWGVFRDRRPMCYDALMTLDGSNKR